MGYLVAEMPEQGAVGFAHLVASPFALGVVGLGEIDCDQPVLMPGQHRRRAIGDKIEGEAVRIAWWREAISASGVYRKGDALRPPSCANGLDYCAGSGRG